MPRFKPVHRGLKLLPVDFDRQVQPGTFASVESPDAREAKKLERLQDEAKRLRVWLDAWLPDTGYRAIKFQGAQQDCVPCELRNQCLRTPEKTQTRQVAFFLGKAEGHESHTDRMKVKIDSDEVVQ